MVMTHDTHGNLLPPMQTAGLLNCRWCKADLRGLKKINYYHYFHCSFDCKKAERKAQLEKAAAKRARKLKRTYKLHTASTKKTPESKTPTVEKPPVEAPGAVKLNKNGRPRKARVEKGPRLCGKCGQPGHNARTCKES